MPLRTYIFDMSSQHHCSSGTLIVAVGHVNQVYVKPRRKQFDSTSFPHFLFAKQTQETTNIREIAHRQIATMSCLVNVAQYRFALVFISSTFNAFCGHYEATNHLTTAKYFPNPYEIFSAKTTSTCVFVSICLLIRFQVQEHEHKKLAETYFFLSELPFPLPPRHI